MDYTLAKELKDAGFPYKDGVYAQLFPKFDKSDPENIEDFFVAVKQRVPVPSLSELIGACGEKFYGLHRMVDGEWLAFMYDIEDSTRQVEMKGLTPEEAVARLWLALNKKTNG